MPIVCSDTLVGEPVVDTRDELLGTLAHLMFDPHTGAIAYVLVARGGVLGLGERLHAIRWSELAFDRARGCFVADIALARLDAARGFDHASWRQMGAEECARAVARSLGAGASDCSRGEKHHPA